MFDLRKRGLSPIIGAVLLIALTVVVGGIIFAWASSFFGEQALKFGEPIDRACEKISFDAELNSVPGSDTRLVISNNGNIPLNCFDVMLVGLGGTEQVGSSICDWENGGVFGGEVEEKLIGDSISEGVDAIVIPIIKGEADDGQVNYNCGEEYGVKTKVGSSGF